MKLVLLTVNIVEETVVNKDTEVRKIERRGEERKREVEKEGGRNCDD